MTCANPHPLKQAGGQPDQTRTCPEGGTYTAPQLQETGVDTMRGNAWRDIPPPPLLNKGVANRDPLRRTGDDCNGQTARLLITGKQQRERVYHTQAVTAGRIRARARQQR